MTIRDRGKLKWAPAAFLPEYTKMLRELDRDYHRQQKPIIDEFQYEEFDQRICYAMEYNYAVKITKWVDGFNYEIVGRIHYVDPIHKIVRLKTKEDEVERVKMADITAVEVME
ncbi:YolD-like family protein [Peribacillus frigoritolerans]|uniref:YolD-like family protein n=1 Tax=Peribacillus frigoritolerans TaxID=450367 RepID=UPI0020A051F4|nr:YolD-like family protein [Peribacillus frigoritolerans]MCP1155507.1 YolD-like family protein [Peribacillus frigoritolerans]